MRRHFGLTYAEQTIREHNRAALIFGIAVCASPFIIVSALLCCVGLIGWGGQ